MSFNYDTEEMELLRKIQSGVRLQENEIRSLINEHDEVDEIEGEDHRWTRDVTTVVSLCGKYVAIDWQKGLTECQENEFLEQPYIVEKRERTVTKTKVEWAPLDPDKDKENEAEEATLNESLEDSIINQFVKELKETRNTELEQEETER